MSSDGTREELEERLFHLGCELARRAERTREDTLKILDAFQVRLATECANEKARAEARLHRPMPYASTAEVEHARWTHEGQRQAAYWCMKHVREVNTCDWLDDYEASCVAATQPEPETPAPAPDAPAPAPDGFVLEDTEES